MKRHEFFEQTFSNVYKNNFSKTFMKNVRLFIVTFAIIFSLMGVYAQENETTNQTSEDISAPVQKILLTNFMPKEVKIGDVQFNVQIENNQNETHCLSQSCQL